MSYQIVPYILTCDCGSTDFHIEVVRHFVTPWMDLIHDQMFFVCKECKLHSEVKDNGNRFRICPQEPYAASDSRFDEQLDAIHTGQQENRYRYPSWNYEKE